MDLFLYGDNITPPIYQYAAQQTGKFADVLNNILVIFLMFYKVRKGNEEVKDFHEPIFRQLFHIAGGIVLMRNLLWIMILLGLHHNTTTLSLLFYFLSTVLWSFDNLLVNITLMFTFLAALQRIVIMYRPKWKHLLTGKPLTWLISAVWLLILVLAIIKSALFFQPNHKLSFNTVTLSFRISFFLSTVASNLIYHHFYKLMSNFTDQHQYHRMHLLYQFVPIHTILTIFTFTQLIMEFVLFMNPEDYLCTQIYNHTGTFLTPFIPTVISLSYIASRDNLRTLITAVLRPIWEDITG